MDSGFANKIAQKCLDLYNSLTKKGKPIPNKEWTLLSGIVMEVEGRLSVVALATGTKCMNLNTMSPRGDVVNDSHAEVLARRCFLRYLYDQILKFQQTSTSDIIISEDIGIYEINPKAKFHFYCSHVPCGDASIIPKQDNKGKKRNLEDDENENTKRNRNMDDCTMSHKALESERDSEICDLSASTYTKGSHCLRANYNPSICQDLDGVVLENTLKHDMEHSAEKVIIENALGYEYEVTCIGEALDIHRTGAKCVSGEDSRLPGMLYHTVGLVRTKPGRGDPTLSVSCSDKLAKWIACGLQGALLSMLLKQPILLSSLVIGAGGPYSPEVLHRAVIARSRTSHRPAFRRSDLVFPHSRYLADSTAKPCPSAILWTQASQKPLEVCVEGKRLGATKKCKDNGRLMACKLELMKIFVSLTGDRFKGLKYKDIKTAATAYNSVWSKTKAALGFWTNKPDHLEHFTF